MGAGKIIAIVQRNVMCVCVCMCICVCVCVCIHEFIPIGRIFGTSGETV